MLIFQPYARPRPLHSFPTRRSSDLSSPSPCRRVQTPPSAYRPRPKPMHSEPARPASHPPSPNAEIHDGKVKEERSEEHTSELQSLRHLVCRLLLEKKNN